MKFRPSGSRSHKFHMSSHTAVVSSTIPTAGRGWLENVCSPGRRLTWQWDISSNRHVSSFFFAYFMESRISERKYDLCLSYMPLRSAPAWLRKTNNYLALNGVEWLSIASLKLISYSARSLYSTIGTAASRKVEYCIHSSVLPSREDFIGCLRSMSPSSWSSEFEGSTNLIFAMQLSSLWLQRRFT